MRSVWVLRYSRRDVLNIKDHRYRVNAMGQHSAQPLGPRATAFHGSLELQAVWVDVHPPVVEPTVPAGLPREEI